MFFYRRGAKNWEGLWSSNFPTDIQERALKKLRQLDAAENIDDLKFPPGNKLEHLKGRRKDQMSIRINIQWRLCFIWKNDGAYNIEIVTRTP
ncbi:MAG: type II toxin-antitoxin system RelE/ParE family toxin [bacterium]